MLESPVIAGIVGVVLFAAVLIPALIFLRRPKPCDHIGTVIVTHPGARSQNNPHNRDVAVGYCTRCNQRFEWNA